MHMSVEFVREVKRTAKELKENGETVTPERIVRILIEKGVSGKKSYNTNVFQQVQKMLDNNS